MGTDDRATWTERRRHAATVHATAQEHRKLTEISQARQLIADFVRRARERGLSTVPLTAHAYTGRARYRTRLRGWYLKADRSIAVGDDGEFYLLGVPASLRARFTGADVRPHDPPLVIGHGGRDGESIPLKTLLERVLGAG
jgi:hypothetical protein